MRPSATSTTSARESQRFRDVLADCDPAARVPGCPDWDAADLLFHLAGVQHFWSTIIRQRPEGPEKLEEPARPETYAELLAFFDTSSAALVAALEEADPAEHAWSWAPEQTVGFTYRRQAHEALIHRLDAEQAAGQETPLDTELAADGVLETLDIMFGGTPPWGAFTPGDGLVRFDLADTGEQILVRLGPLLRHRPREREDLHRRGGPLRGPRRRHASRTWSSPAPRQRWTRGCGAAATTPASPWPATRVSTRGSARS